MTDKSREVLKFWLEELDPNNGLILLDQFSRNIYHGKPGSSF